MSYLSYLQGIFGSSITVTNELNNNYNGDGTVVVIKYLQGSIYQDSTIQPIQLAVYTDDMPATKTLLETITKAYNDVSFTDGLDYVKQFYGTPLLLSAYQPAGNNYTSQYIVSVTLIISSNISDIKTVYIDGNLLTTTSRNMNYIAGVDNQRDSAGYINTTEITNGILKFTCTVVNRGDDLNTKIRGIRKGLLDINTTFAIKLTYTDNDEIEEYSMKLDSSSVNSNNQALPVLSLGFIV